MSLGDIIAGQLDALLRLAALPEPIARRTRAAYGILTRGALDRPATPPYAGLARINPDGMPFQWSFCLGGEPSVRFLCEVGPPGASAGERFHRSQTALQLALEALDVPRPRWLWERVMPAIVPPVDRLPPNWLSAIWFAVGATRRSVLVKVYLNLAHGPPVERWRRVGRMLSTLGRRQSLARLCEISSRVSRDSWPVGIAFDVRSDGEPGRVKAYFHGGEVWPAWLEAWYIAAGLERDLPVVREALAVFPWHADRPYWAKSLFVSAEFGTREELTLKSDLAVSRWVATDARILGGVRRLARAMRLDVRPYLSALRSLGDWPVTAAATMTHHVVGIGSEKDGSRHLNVYCEPRVGNHVTGNRA